MCHIDILTTVLVLLILNSSNKIVLSTKEMEVEADNKFNHISNACSKFSNNFHRVLTTGNQENVVCSPLSAHIILSLLSHGATGPTEEELKSGLHLPDAESLHKALDHLLPVFESVEQIDLNVANAVFVQEEVQLVQDFLSAAKEHFRSHIANVDFKNNVVSANLINAWIKEKTNGKLGDAIDKDSIDEFTKLILVNALYFKGKWLHPFKPEATEKKVFHALGNKKYHIPMMFQKNDFVHGIVESLDASVLQLPYINEDFDMIVILPNKMNGLQELEEKFDWNEISNHNLFSTKVEVYLPKFKFEGTINLVETLRKLGMNTMFSDKANFTRMASLPLVVSQVFQKIFIDVNEEGSEAAAATVVQIRLRRMAVEPDRFEVDHPFMFAIRHKPSNVPLFIGSVRDLESFSIQRDEL